ncbi:MULTISPECIES: hypothetical protein [unclassified Streptomyces]|uniref:hypothetical protein n=1 Tax=unclassified Streptomyces TaxID=2593676 RepID=UPI000C2769F8|nr:hypothetical protein [Streptomyces sp. CB02959]PJN36266.1 hypothetical protein CG747_34640 [Streptomyces sp. CB02959]
MRNTHRLVRTGLVALLMAGLGACGSGANGAAGHPGNDGRGTGTSGQGAPPHQDGVFGLRAGVRHLVKQTTTGTRPHLVTTCTPATRQVKHTKRSGRTKKTWYSTEHYQDCRKTARGTETYRRVIRPERWCVRLDDVNGNPKKDAVWYRVTSATYHQALGTDAHARLRFTPTGTGC